MPMLFEPIIRTTTAGSIPESSPCWTRQRRCSIRSLPMPKLAAFLGSNRDCQIDKPSPSKGVLPEPSHPRVIESPRKSRSTCPAIARETIALCSGSQPGSSGLGVAFRGDRRSGGRFAIAEKWAKTIPARRLGRSRRIRMRRIARNRFIA